MTYNLVKVARAPVMVCLQCPLCCNLVHEATTISECLHTFCRDCIYQRLGDGESDCCPICNVNLGCSPLEKLRADHQLDDVRAKIFPVKLKKRKVVDNNADCDAPAPVRRKERSLSSLGIGAVPLSANPGFVSRRTKSVSRRSVTIRDTSADNEFEDKKTDKLNLKNLGAEKDRLEVKSTKGDLIEAYSSDGKVAPFSEGRHEILITAKREVISDDEREANEAEALPTQKAGQFVSPKRAILPKVSQEISRVPNFASNGSDSLSKLGMYLAERSKISATGLLRTQGAESSDLHDKLFGKQDKTEPQGVDNSKLSPAIPGIRERAGKGLKRRSTLAHLAEVAVDQAGNIESSEHHKSRGPRARRGRGKIENEKGLAVAENFNWRPDKNPSAAVSQLQPKLPPSGRPSTVLDKLPVVRNIGSSGGTPANTVSITRQDKRNSGFWFALQASENQMGDNALPQIPTRYLRIKDGKLPVSIVKKYLMKKLDLKSESEVEITCRGQPVVPNLPLESVQGIWFATMPPSELLHSLKEVNAASYDSRKWAQVRGTSADDYMMVLTYGRHRRPMAGH